jgi:RNA polymerase sigma-70 factor (ECF subfamily)
MSRPDLPWPELDAGTADEIPLPRPRQRASRSHAAPPGRPPSTAERFAATALPFLDLVHDLALWLTNDPGAARELTFDTYLRGLRSFGSFQPGSSCRAWLLRLAYATFLTHYKERRRELVQVVDADESEFEPVVRLGATAGRSPVRSELAAIDEPDTLLPVGLEVVTQAELVAAGDHRARLRLAIAQLPETFRLAVVLLDVLGLTPREAAMVLAVPSAELLARLRRARLRLRPLTAGRQVGGRAL